MTLLLLAAAIWGFAFVAQREGMRYVGPFTFNGVRFLLGGIVLLPLVFLFRRHAGRDAPSGILKGPRAILAFGGAGILLFGGASLQQVGMVYTSAGRAGFLTGLYVVGVPCLGLLAGQRNSRWLWMGALAAAAGLYLLNARGAARPDSEHILFTAAGMTVGLGDLLVLASAFFWAGHVQFIGWLTRRADSLHIAVSQFILCGLVSLAVAAGAETVTASDLRGALIPILYAGLLSTGVAYTLQIVAQKKSPPTPAAIILSLEAVFALIGGVALLGEALSLPSLAGCGLMLAGMILAQLRAQPEGNLT